MATHSAGVHVISSLRVTNRAFACCSLVAAMMYQKNQAMHAGGMHAGDAQLRYTVCGCIVVLNPMMIQLFIIVHHWYLQHVQHIHDTPLIRRHPGNMHHASCRWHTLIRGISAHTYCI
jgi:hypothetical protein